MAQWELFTLISILCSNWKIEYVFFRSAFAKRQQSINGNYLNKNYIWAMNGMYVFVCGTYNQFTLYYFSIVHF